MAIPVETTSCPLAGNFVSAFVYMLCPATFADPLVGILASADSFLTLTIWSLVLWPFLDGILENLVVKVPSRTSASGIT